MSRHQKSLVYLLFVGLLLQRVVGWKRLFMNGFYNTCFACLQKKKKNVFLEILRTEGFRIMPWDLIFSEKVSNGADVGSAGQEISRYEQSMQQKLGGGVGKCE